MGLALLLRRLGLRHGFRLREGFGGPLRGEGQDAALGAGLDAFQRDLRALRKELAAADRQLQRAAQRVEQLIVVRREEERGVEALERLAPVMDLDAGARYVREAIVGGRRVEQPRPHLLMGPLLPPGLYAALLEAIPPPVFFERGRSGCGELPIPPSLAPLQAYATWKFFARLVRRAAVPALVAAFGDELGSRVGSRPASEGYLIRSETGTGDGGRSPGRDPVLRLVLELAPEGDASANTAVAFPAAGDVALPALTGATAGLGRHRYELAISARFRRG